MGIKNIVNRLTASNESVNLNRESIKERIKEWIYVLLNTAIARGSVEAQFDALFDVTKALNYIASRPMSSAVITVDRGRRQVRLLQNDFMGSTITVLNPDELLEMLETCVDYYVNNYYRNYFQITVGSRLYRNRNENYAAEIKRFNRDLEEIRTHVLNTTSVYIPDLDFYGFNSNDDVDLSWVNESITNSPREQEIRTALVEWIQLLVQIIPQGDDATRYRILIDILKFLNRTTGWIRFQRLMIIDDKTKTFVLSNNDYGEPYYNEDNDETYTIETADDLEKFMLQLADDYAAAVYIYFFTNDFSEDLEKDVEEFNRWINQFNHNFAVIPFELEPLRDTDLSWVNESISYTQFVEYKKMLESWYKDLIAFNFPKGEAVNFNKVADMIYLFKNTGPRSSRFISVYFEKVQEGEWYVTSLNFKIYDRYVTREQLPTLLYELAEKYADFNTREFQAEARQNAQDNPEQMKSIMVNDIREFLSGYDASINIIAFETYLSDDADLSWVNESVALPEAQSLTTQLKDWMTDIMRINVNFDKKPGLTAIDNVVNLLIDVVPIDVTYYVGDYEYNKIYNIGIRVNGKIVINEVIETQDDWIVFVDKVTSLLTNLTVNDFMKRADDLVEYAARLLSDYIKEQLETSFIAAYGKLHIQPFEVTEESDLAWANEAASGELTKEQLLSSIEDWLEEVITTAVERDNYRSVWFDDLDYALETIYVLLIELVGTNAKNFIIDFSQDENDSNSTMVRIGNSTKVYGVPYHSSMRTTQKMADEYNRLVADCIASIPVIAKAIYRTQTFSENYTPQQVADNMNTVIGTSHHEDSDFNLPLITFNTYKEDISWANESVEPEVMYAYTEDVLEWLEDSLVSLHNTAKENDDDIKSALHDFVHTVLDYSLYDHEPAVSKVFYNSKKTDDYLFNFIYSELPTLTKLLLAALKQHSRITRDNTAEDLSEVLNAIARITSKSRRMSGKVRTIFVPFVLKSLYKEDVSWMNEAAVLSSVPTMSEILEQVTAWMTEWISNNNDGTLERLIEILKLLTHIIPRGPVFTFKRGRDNSLDVGVWINSYLKDIIVVTEDTSHILHDLLLKHVEDFAHAITIGYLLQGSRRDVLDATRLFNEILQNRLDTLELDLVIYDLELERDEEDLSWANESVVLNPTEALTEDVLEWLEESLHVLKQRESALGAETYLKALKDFREVIALQINITLPKSTETMAEKLYDIIYKSLPVLAEDIIRTFRDHENLHEIIPVFLNVVQKNQHVRGSSHYGSTPRPLFIPFEKRVQHNYKEDVSWMNESVQYKTIQYGNTNDIGVGSVGILKLPVFIGSYKKPKYSHDEYYKVKVIADNYADNQTHRFTVEVLEVLEGTSKKVGSKFWKQGRNFYDNYSEITPANQETLDKKHKRKEVLTSQGRVR